MAAPDTLSATQLLRQRHREIEDLFAKTLDASSGDERAELFDCLRATLAVHETTEELFVHPLARRAEGGDTIVDKRLAEEHLAKETLKELEQLGADGDQFATRLALFRRDVVDHAGHEEREVFPLIDSMCTQEELITLADAIMAGERLAPTHPHPHAGENPLVLLAAGPFAAMVDKARDHFKTWTQSRAGND